VRTVLIPAVVLPSHAELAARLVLAAVLGACVGLEREISGQNAGIRTHLSVALGAALFGIISAYGFNTFDQGRNNTIYQIDVTRVASQVVVGVGFLGGGAIIKQGASVRGLTTAASLWVSAAIGLAVGLGGYFIGGVTTAVLLFALVGLRGPRRWIERNLAVHKDSVSVLLVPGADPAEVLKALHDLPGVEVRSLSMRPNNGQVEIRAQLRASRGANLEVLLGGIAERDDVDDMDTN
jgi:putative Mg2+ transporter-C (MgtC) family protein